MSLDSGSMKKYTFIAFLSLSLISCMGVPKLEEESRKTLVKTNATKKSEVIFQSEEWWLNSRDANLDALIREVLSKNSEIKVARLNIEKAMHGLQATKMANLSPISVSGSYSRSRLTDTDIDTNFKMIGEPKSSGTTNVGTIGVQASYTLDLWGKYEALSKQAKYTKLATELQRKWIVLNISTTVSNLYGEYILLAKRIEIYRDKLTLLEEMVEFQETLYSTGLGNKNDLLTTKNNFESVKQAIATLENNQYILTNAFYSLVGEIKSPVIEKTLKEASQNKTSFAKFLKTPESIDSDLIVNRPDIQYYLALINAQKENIISTKADFYPRFSINGKYEYQSIDILNVINGSANLWAIGPSVYLPLFNRNALKQKYKIAGTELNIFIENYNDNLIKAYLGANNSLNTLKITDYNNKLENKKYSNSKENLENSKTLHKIGTISKYEYLVRRDDYLNAELSLMESEYNLYKSQLGIINSLGGYYKDEVR